jgi:ketosteroid isomerase-like protein
MHERAFYEQAATAYLAAVDRLDADAVLELFAEEPTLVMEPLGAVLRGRSQVHGALAGLMAESAGMRHEILALIVDRDEGTVGIELNFHNTAKDGSTAVLHDATHLQFDAEGKILTAQFWLGHDAAQA